MSQTITPEERAQRVKDCRMYLEEDCTCESCSSITFLLDELERVKQEALAQGWDDCAAAAKERLFVANIDPSIQEELRDLNPHRAPSTPPEESQ